MQKLNHANRCKQTLGSIAKASIGLDTAAVTSACLDSGGRLSPRAIWMYRNFKDPPRSCCERSCPLWRTMRPLWDQKEPQSRCWGSECGILLAEPCWRWSLPLECLMWRETQILLGKKSTPSAKLKLRWSVVVLNKQSFKTWLFINNVVVHELHSCLYHYAVCFHTFKKWYDLCWGLKSKMLLMARGPRDANVWPKLHCSLVLSTWLDPARSKTCWGYSACYTICFSCIAHTAAKQILRQPSAKTWLSHFFCSYSSGLEVNMTDLLLLLCEQRQVLESFIEACYITFLTVESGIRCPEGLRAAKQTDVQTYLPEIPQVHKQSNRDLMHEDPCLVSQEERNVPRRPVHVWV